MLTSINPLGQRGRGHRWGPSVLLFVLASTLGGLTTGAVLGLLGEAVHVPVVVGALACAVAVVLDLTRVPSYRRQVEREWLVRYRMWVYSTGFGWQLGTGVVTIVTSASTYAWLVLLVVAGLPGALVGGAVFGLVRALPLLLARRAVTPEALRALAAGVVERLALARAVTVGVLAAGAVGLLA